jgi:catalase
MNKMTVGFSAPVDDNQNIKTSSMRGPALLENTRLMEETAHFAPEVISGQPMSAKGADGFGAITMTHNVTRYTDAKYANNLLQGKSVIERRFGFFAVAVGIFLALYLGTAALMVSLPGSY